MNIIYNLSEYVSNNTSIVPVTGGIDPSDTDAEMILIGTGGEDKSRGLYYTETFQFLSRSIDRVTGNQLLQTIYDLLANRFRITLPEVTVGTETYSSVTVGQILPIQTPGYVGVNENGLHQWSVNFQVTVRR